MEIMSLETPNIVNVSLCAIVRDEVMNPAGGIVDFVDCTMPFVEAGIIVDTGSLDGTRELLEELSSKYSNLKIFDTKFRGYSSARNFSLDYVETKHALVLDADERLSKEDFKVMGLALEQSKLEGYNLDIEHISPNQILFSDGLHNPRLFDNTCGFIYKPVDVLSLNKEWLYGGKDKKVRVINFLPEESDLDIRIKHFRSGEVNDLDFKNFEWYGKLNKNVCNSIAPSQTKGFEEWKKRNPLRDDYVFGI
jgi:glycosyltransferase involved in cell wall biosynthesis